MAPVTVINWSDDNRGGYFLGAGVRYCYCLVRVCVGIFYVCVFLWRSGGSIEGKE